LTKNVVIERLDIIGSLGSTSHGLKVLVAKSDGRSAHTLPYWYTLGSIHSSPALLWNAAIIHAPQYVKYVAAMSIALLF
jgi:hypothetical protein